MGGWVRALIIRYALCAMLDRMVSQRKLPQTTMRYNNAIEDASKHDCKRQHLTAQNATLHHPTHRRTTQGYNQRR
jgi:hypothetical protein